MGELRVAIRLGGVAFAAFMDEAGKLANLAKAIGYFDGNTTQAEKLLGIHARKAPAEPS